MEKKRLWVFTLGGWKQYYEGLDDEFDVRVFTDHKKAKGAFEEEMDGGKLPHLVVMEREFGPEDDAMKLIQRLKQDQERGAPTANTRSKFAIRLPYGGSISEEKAKEVGVSIFHHGLYGNPLREKLHKVLE